MIIDTHSHLYGEEFADDLDEVLLRARTSGIDKIFLPNINADSVGPMLTLACQHPGFLYPMMGLHPEDLGTNWREVLVKMEAMLASPDNPFIAIGEVGLDYYWDRTLYAEQQEAFAIQVEWAMRFELPLMIHTRSAHREVVDVLRQIVNCKSVNSKLCGAFPCFGGTADEARELLDFEGFMLGIGGVVTFKKSSLPEVLRQAVPLDRIVVETDAPYLAPVPYRGKRNESAYIIATIKKLAEIYDVSEQEICEITSRNAIQTFPKAGQPTLSAPKNKKKAP